MLRFSFGVLVMVGSCAAFACASPASAASGSAITGSMSQGRIDATGVRLPSNQVLVAGGRFDGGTGEVTLSGAELFDPSTGTWRSTGSLNQARYGAGAALLPDGKVLVAGGTADAGGPTTVNKLAMSTEIYTPATGTWTAGPSTNSPHVYPAITGLKDGSVLIAGGAQLVVSPAVIGLTIDLPVGPSEIYTPATSTWRSTGPMLADDTNLRTALLSDGRVFAGCGDGSGDFEIFDPTAGGGLGVWRMAAAPPVSLASCALSRLPDGRVLVAGGYAGLPTMVTVAAAAYLYDPATDSWTSTASMNAPRASGVSTALPDGRVVISAGTDAVGFEESATEIYQPATGTWATPTSAPSLALARSTGETTVLLADGTVLVTGGVGPPNSPSFPRGFSEAEVLRP